MICATVEEIQKEYERLYDLAAKCDCDILACYYQSCMAELEELVSAYFSPEDTMLMIHHATSKVIEGRC